MSCRNSTYVHLFAGGVGGTTAAVLTCPLEVVKTRLQSSGPVFQPLPVPSVVGASSCGTVNVAMAKPSGIYRCFRHMIHTEGIRSLYKGLGPNLVGVAPARAIYFAVYAKSKRLLCRQSNLLSSDSKIVHVVSGASAGFVTHTCTAPIWFVKTKLQLHSSFRGDRLNSWKCIRSVYTKEGIKGFYRGLSASYVGIIETVIHFVIYEEIKKDLRKAHSSHGAGGSKEIGSLKGKNLFSDFMLAAGFSKTVASIVAYPHEVVRTRLRQEDSVGPRKYRSFFQTLILVAREEGRMGLYGGLFTQLVRQVPNSAVMFMTYETIVAFLCNGEEE